MTPAAEKYVIGVKQSLKCSKKSREHCLKNLRKILDEMERSSNYTYEDYVEQFGEPSSVAEEYLSVMTKKELRYFTRAHKLVLALALILVVALSLFLIIYNAMLSDYPGVIRESETIEVTSDREPISVVEF